MDETDAKSGLHRCLSVDALLEAQEQETVPIKNRTHSAGDSNLPPCDPLRKNSLDAWVGSFFDSEQNPMVPTDDGSVASSTAYFSRSDFMQTNWENASEYIPPIGFAVVVAGGLVLCHPLVFLAGALTAIGTATAVGVSADSCMDGSFCHLFDKEEEDDETEDEVPLLKQGFSEVTFSLEEEEKDGEYNMIPIGDEPESITEPERRNDPSAFKTAKEALDWVAMYYPPLQFIVIKNVEFNGLNALEFFDVFFANDAPYTFLEFQKKRQDKDIQYGQWETLENVQQPSLHSKALGCPDLHLPLKERILNFKAKTNSYFGPPYATTTKVQRCLVASKRLLVLEAKTTVTDVPFCERFFIMERWVVTAEKRGDDRYHATLSIFAQVFFTKKCAFESQVISKSQETFLEIAQQWNAMAQEALKLTEQARKKRLRNGDETATNHEDPAEKELKSLVDEEDEDAQSVEVRRVGSSKSWVVGEGDEPEKEPETPERQKSSIRKVTRSFSNYMKRRPSFDPRKRTSAADVVAPVS